MSLPIKLRSERKQQKLMFLAPIIGKEEAVHFAVLSDWNR